MWPQFEVGFNHIAILTQCIFSLRVVIRWNSLTQETVEGQTVYDFKRHLDRPGLSKWVYPLYVRITLLASDSDTRLGV